VVGLPSFVLDVGLSHSVTLDRQGRTLLKRSKIFHRREVLGEVALDADALARSFRSDR